MAWALGSSMLDNPALSKVPLVPPQYLHLSQPLPLLLLPLPPQNPLLLLPFLQHFLLTFLPQLPVLWAPHAVQHKFKVDSMLPLWEVTNGEAGTISIHVPLFMADLVQIEIKLGIYFEDPSKFIK